ncbi:HNH endonuclease signature motif containing protein [Oryzobacter sp. R7]|uniref:HNH endonuclease signature motif containing protein n=1 Tax=Oryzobacter faecalis TaxID=3388656 RepID=UPI00398D3C72
MGRLLPSEDAAKAWAAIDARAHQLLTDGTAERIDRALAQALIDFVMQSATVTTVITLTVPANDVEPATPDDGGFVEVATARGTEQVLVSAAWLTDQVSTANAVTSCSSSPSNGRKGTRGAVRTGDPVRVETQHCDPVTGALLSDLESGAYRPPQRIAALVRQRDGRRRFPGCHVAARFCDLDHVRPWPDGPTTPWNLIALCRRHHRIKQRPGWRAVLHPDGTVDWTDPTGRVRTTLPVDALHTVTLADTSTEAAHSTPATPRIGAEESAPFSHLELTLEHLVRPDATTLRRPRATTTTTRSGAPVSVIRPADTFTVSGARRPCRRPRAAKDRFPDEPPF